MHRQPPASCAEALLAERVIQTAIRLLSEIAVMEREEVYTVQDMRYCGDSCLHTQTSYRELEEDTAVLKARMASVAADCGASAAQVPDDYVEEMVRCGAAELHVMGAIMGGIAAQEIIKFVTHQFVPVPGVLIYNAMASTSSVFVP